MNISNNNQSFTGAFRIKPFEVKAKTDIPNLFSQGRQIFQDILEKGDQVIVVRDKYDKKVYKYLKDENIQGVEYFPEINTRCGLDNEVPEGLLKLIKDNAVKVVTELKEIGEISKFQKTSATPSKSINILNSVINALRLNVENPKIVHTSQSTKIRDDYKQRTIEVVVHNKRSAYVYVKPDKPYEDSIKCIINSKGEIRTFENPEELKNFWRIFRKLKAKNLNILSD